ncbi:hypothetical protein RRSWK_06225 [Rhodopirellula sp. SWK7]|nr:hypothetical protein RRSWK_06225 [Rhodopirellula sp. SWK7]
MLVLSVLHGRGRNIRYEPHTLTTWKTHELAAFSLSRQERSTSNLLSNVRQPTSSTQTSAVGEMGVANQEPKSIAFCNVSFGHGSQSANAAKS